MFRYSTRTVESQRYWLCNNWKCDATNLICYTFVGACRAEELGDKRWARGTTFSRSIELVFRRTFQHWAGFLHAHRRLVVARTCWTYIWLHGLIFRRREVIAHHETAAWKVKRVSWRQAGDNDDGATFNRCVGDIFSTLLAAAARWRVLELRRALKNRTSFLHARQLLDIALALDARVFRQRHLALLKDILTVQVTTCVERRKRLK